MENNVRKILMDRPLVIPRIIINNYKKLIIFLYYQMEKKENICYNIHED